MSTSDQIESDLESQLEVSGIDPTLIATVVETILGLLTRCRNKQATLNSMRSPGRLERVLVRNELRKELRERNQAVTAAQLDQLTDQVLNAARKSTDDTRSALIDHATQFQTI